MRIFLKYFFGFIRYFFRLFYFSCFLNFFIIVNFLGAFLQSFVVVLSLLFLVRILFGCAHALGIFKYEYEFEYAYEFQFEYVYTVSYTSVECILALVVRPGKTQPNQARLENKLRRERRLRDAETRRRA